MRPTQPCRSAFTLIELLIVISVIGIIAGLVIAAYSNAAQDSRRVVASQQQAVIQSAVDDWISSAMTTNSDGSIRSMTAAEARATYNALSTSAARLNLVQAYLHDTTTAQFSTNSSGLLQSEVMNKTSQYVTLGDWADGSYPKVELHDAP
jgi:prepilin-type N-terminal cleavage/methylation domain-containing protein